MPVAHRQVGCVVVVAVTGRLVIGGETEQLERLVSELAEQGSLKFVFDVSELDGADSAGIGAIVSCLTLIGKAGGESRLAGAKPRFERALNLTALGTLLQFYASVDDAVRA